jgi:glucose dehydrogenase
MYFTSMSRNRTKGIIAMLRLCALFTITTGFELSAHAVDPKDWPTYNGDVTGARHNAGETALGSKNVVNLEEKWRFPARDSKGQIGVVHATPVIVDGCVYFGTVSKPTFYALTPNGKLKWLYPLAGRLTPDSKVKKPKGDSLDSGEAAGVFGSALVTDDGVYFADLDGFLYALDRQTGKEKWKIDTRAKDFPDAHPLNATFASPILANVNVVFAGGAFEQWYAHKSTYRGCTGRGYLVAIESKTGKIAWKYDVGPKPAPLNPPVTIKDAYGEHTFYFGPSTSTIWATPSYDAATQTIYFGTDTNNSPRQPTKEDDRLDTKYACAAIAIDARDGKEKWVTQINPGDIWHRGMRAYDAEKKRYLDQAIGDTPKIYTIDLNGKQAKVIGFGCKNGGFYVLDAEGGKVINHTPLYKGAPAYPLEPTPDERMIALPGPLGGIQTGCATDGKTIFTNGIDMLQFGTQESEAAGLKPPTGGRVVGISMDARAERWRHERPKTEPPGSFVKMLAKEVGDPVASGLAVANGVIYFTSTVSAKLVALDAANGKVLKEINLGAVWSGPAVSRGRIYVGTGNLLFTQEGSASMFNIFPNQKNGAVISFGLPGEDEVTKLGNGR